MNIFVGKNEFTVRQTRIYNEIEENALNLDRLKKAEFRNNGGYIIALRHSDNAIEIIKELNEKISEIIPIMKYDEFNIHTTMASFGECPEFKPVEQVLDTISDILLSASAGYEKMKIYYYNLLLDYSALILAGKFNGAFYKNCKNIISALQSENMEIKFPWGTHITVCRFLEDGDNKKVQQLKNVLGNYETEIYSEPQAIDIGYYTNDGKKFELHTYKRIML